MLNAVSCFLNSIFMFQESVLRSCLCEVFLVLKKTSDLQNNEIYWL